MKVINCEEKEMVPLTTKQKFVMYEKKKHCNYYIKYYKVRNLVILLKSKIQNTKINSSNIS